MRALGMLAVAFLLVSGGRAFAEDPPTLPSGSPVETEFLKGLPGLGAKARARRQELFAVLCAGESPPSAAVMQGIAREHDQLVRTLKGRLDASHLKSLREQAKADLATRRKEALTFIRDENRYPYFGPSEGKPATEDPYGPRGKEIQEQVDALVAAVEEAYRPSVGGLDRRLRKGKSTQSRSTADVLAALEESETYLQAGGTLSGETFRILLEQVLPKLDLSREAEAAKGDARVLEENALLAKKLQASNALDGQEVACMLITNRYRIMMGLNPLRLDPRLVQASRGHSLDMATRGYFAHVDPDGKGPGDRACAVGFQSGVGENIAMGIATGEGAFLGWQHSSGHHRNMLRAGYAEIGVGRSDLHWTMMLGSEGTVRAPGR